MSKRVKTVFTVLILILISNHIYAGGQSSQQTAGKTNLNWPRNTLSIIVPVDVGGNMDVKARIVAKYLPKYIGGVNVIVENRPGAGGITALTEYLVEPPNTSSLLYVSGSHVVINPYYNNVRYTRNDFIPLVCTDEVLNGLFVSPEKTGARNLQELITYGQGKIVKFGASATGDTYLMTKALLTMAGLRSDVVDANSAPEHLVNTMAGHVDLGYAGLNLGRAYVEEGKLVCIGAFTEKPYTGFKGTTVPSFKEQGYDIVHSAFTYFTIRSGTDQAIVDYIKNALMQVMQDPEFRNEFTNAGFDIVDDPSPEAIQRKINILANNLEELNKLISR